MSSSSILLIGGEVWSGGSHHRPATAVLLDGGRIRWLGDARDAPAADRRIECGQGCILPGLTDAHLHLFARAQERLEVEIGPEIGSVAELLETLRSAATARPDQPWIVAGGYNEQRLRERRHPRRDELDDVAGGRPVLLRRTGGHLAVANTTALRAAGWGEDAENPPAGELVRENGRITGVLTETAADIAVGKAPQPSAAALSEAVRQVAEDCLAQGIVAAVEAAVGFFTNDFAAEWEVWSRLRGQGLFPLRMGFMLRLDPADAAALDLAPTAVDLDWQVRTLKFFVDGIIGARSAALSEPYTDRDTLGFFMDEPDALRAKVMAGHQAGWQLAAHTIGDRAIDLWLDCLAQAQREHPRPDPRHRFEHFALPAPGAATRAAALGAAAVTQHGFVRRLGASFAEAVGERLAGRLYPGRSLLDAGVVLSGSSDLPIGPLSPFVGMAAALDRLDAGGRAIASGEAISLGEAIASYTTAGAWVMGQERQRGAIAPGLAADLVVLDHSAAEIQEPETLRAAKPRLTIVRGEIAYSDGSLA